MNEDRGVGAGIALKSVWHSGEEEDWNIQLDAFREWVNPCSQARERSIYFGCDSLRNYVGEYHDPIFIFAENAFKKIFLD